MLLGALASQSRIWQKSMFKLVSSNDTLAGVAKSLTLRLGSMGEQAGDLAVIAVLHRSKLSVPDGFTVASSQVATDNSGIVQYMTVVYAKLASADLGRALTFTQILDKRMTVMFSVFRPANIGPPVTVAASQTSQQVNAAAPWPAAPVTATNVGQLIVQVQGRVAAADTDKYSAPAGVNDLGRGTGRRLCMGYRTVNDNPAQGGSFGLANGIYPDTTVLSSSIVFNINVPGTPQNIPWNSVGATTAPISSDITEDAHVWRVRPDAEPTYWHKASGSPGKLHAGRVYFEVEILEGPAKGGSRVWAIGLATAVSTASGVGFSADPGIAGRTQWFNDGRVRNPDTGDYGDALTPAWGVGDILGISVETNQLGAGEVRAYINGVYVGILPFATPAGFTAIYPHVCKLGGSGALKFRTVLQRLPENNRVWN